MDSIAVKQTQRYLIRCRLASDAKAPWHVYERFSSKDQRDRILAKVKKQPKLNFLVFKAGLL